MLKLVNMFTFYSHDPSSKPSVKFLKRTKINEKRPFLYKINNCLPPRVLQICAYQKMLQETQAFSIILRHDSMNFAEFQSPPFCTWPWIALNVCQSASFFFLFLYCRRQIAKISRLTTTATTTATGGSYTNPQHLWPIL